VLEIISTWKFPQPTTMCTTCSYGRRFEADRRLLLPWKRNTEACLMWEMSWYVNCLLLSLECSFCIHFRAHFSSGRVTAPASLGWLEMPHGQQQSQIFLLLQHQDMTKQGWRYNHSVWSYSRGYSQQDTPRQSFPGPNQRS